MIPAAPSGRPRRDLAFKVGCPRCEAGPGFACEGDDGRPRKSAHAERHANIKGTHTRGKSRRAALPKGDGFYTTPEWRRLRYSVLRASDGRCECCGARPSPSKPLHVDHIKPRSRFPELALVRSNLQVLCEDCNLGKGNSDTRDWRDQQGSASP